MRVRILVFAIGALLTVGVAEVAAAPSAPAPGPIQLDCLDTASTPRPTAATQPGDLVVGNLRFELLGSRVSSQFKPTPGTEVRYRGEAAYFLKAPIAISPKAGQAAVISVLAPRGAGLFYVNSQKWNSSMPFAQDVAADARPSLRIATDCAGTTSVAPTATYHGGVLVPAATCLRLRVSFDTQPARDVAIPVGVPHC